MFSQISRILIGCIILIALSGVFQTATAATEEDILALHKAHQEALNGHDMNLLLSYLTDDVMWDYVSTPPSMNKEQIKAYFEGLFQAFPDFQVTPGRVLVSGNILVEEHPWIGTHSGEWMGVPATGNSVQGPHIDIWEFEGDKVKRATTYLDVVSFLVQIGAMPAAELDPALLVPSFTVPEAEPTGLTPLEANADTWSRWNSHDLSSYAKVVHPDAEVLLGPLGVTLDRDAYIAAQEMYLLAFPDIHGEVTRCVDMGDGWVVSEVVFTGTNVGPYFGIPATRRPVEVRGVALHRFDADGLITNLSTYFDNLTVLAQLGLFPPPDPEANKALARRLYGEVWNQGNLDAIEEIVAPDYVCHLPYGGTVTGFEGEKQHCNVNKTAFPDFHITFDDVITEGDKVTIRCTYTGTHQGELMGIPATGAQITLTGVLEVHIVDSKIAEVWSIADMAGLMEQLGVMPPTHEDYTWGAPSEVTGAPGDPQANTALVLYVVEKFWNQKNVNVLGETHSSDSIGHNPVMPVNPLPFDFYKQAALIHIAAFPDMKVTTDDIIAEWDKVVIRWTVTGTHQGELMGIPASGRQVTWSGFTIYRFADGKIVESWWAYDALGMMQQITEEKVDVEADIAAIEDVLNQYAVTANAGDLELWLSLHADDVVKMPPDAPAIFGKEDLRANFKPAFDNFNTSCVLYPEEAQVDGDLGFARGTYSISITPKAGGETISVMPDGKYLTICKRQADGSWKISHDCYNSNVPPTVE